MADNLIPRIKGENDAQFMTRIHTTLEKKHKSEATKAIGKSAQTKQMKAIAKREVRKELKKIDTAPREKKVDRFVTSGIELSNPFKDGHGFRRIRERRVTA